MIEEDGISFPSTGSFKLSVKLETVGADGKDFLSLPCVPNLSPLWCRKRDPAPFPDRISHTLKTF